MSQSEIFEHVVGVLDRLGIPYMIVGSIASTVYGKPRLTHDVDVVVDLKTDKIAQLIANFDETWSIDEQMIRRAVEAKFHFNVIHKPSGNKIDFFILQDSSYDQQQFARRTKQEFDENRFAFFARVEDVIIRKMDYYMEGGSTRHLEDIRGILETYEGEIDDDYITRWATERGTSEIWEQLRRET